MSQRTLFVFNIPHDLPERELAEQFAYFGHIRRIRLIREKGYGFVEMGRAEEAATAVKGVNGIILRGAPIKVELARPRKKKKMNPRKSPPESRHAHKADSSEEKNHPDASRV